MNADARGWRMALVPDSLINPPDRARAALPDVLGALDANGYGVLQLPPPGGHSLLLAVIADQIAEYAHHGSRSSDRPTCSVHCGPSTQFTPSSDAAGRVVQRKSITFQRKV